MWNISLISFVAAVANAGRAHEFFAENNYICELCKQVIDLTATGKEAELDALYAKFPKLESRISYFMDKAELINLAEPEQTCRNIELCSENSLMEDLREEEPLDLA